MSQAKTLSTIDSHEDYSQYLEHKFRKSGWYVKTEVTPKRDNKRADMIIYNSDVIDEWIGLELKYWGSTRSSSNFIPAVDQIINRYRYKSWPNKEIRLWVFAPYIAGSYEESEWGEKNQFAENAICNITNSLGIGYLDHHFHKTKFRFDGKWTLPAFARQPSENQQFIDKFWEYCPYSKDEYISRLLDICLPKQPKAEWLENAR